MIHKIKCAPKYFQQIKAGIKTFELRKNDRDYKELDTLILEEWDDGYTGEIYIARVTSILKDFEFKGIQNGWCIMSIKELKSV